MEDLRDYSRQEETAKPKGLEARHTTNLREGDLAFGVLVFLFTLPLHPLDNMGDADADALLRMIEDKLAAELPPLT